MLFHMDISYRAVPCRLVWHNQINLLFICWYGDISIDCVKTFLCAKIEIIRLGRYCYNKFCEVQLLKSIRLNKNDKQSRWVYWYRVSSIRSLQSRFLRFINTCTHYTFNSFHFISSRILHWNSLSTEIKSINSF